MSTVKTEFKNADGQVLSAKLELLEIAEKCPVHKTLSSSSIIETTLKK